MTDENLDAQIKAAREKANPEAAKPQIPDAVPPAAGMGIGLTLVVSIFVCGAIGYTIDKWMDSAPWGLVIFLLLGIASGFYSVYKASKGL